MTTKPYAQLTDDERAANVLEAFAPFAGLRTLMANRLSEIVNADIGDFLELPDGYDAEEIGEQEELEVQKSIRLGKCPCGYFCERCT